MLLSNEQQKEFDARFGGGVHVSSDDDYDLSEEDLANFTRGFCDFVRRSPHIPPDEKEIILEATRDFVENPLGYTMPMH